MMHILFVLIFVVLIPAEILAQNSVNLDTLNWVLGVWQQENERSITTESWIKLSSNTFDGSTRTRAKDDNKITENMYGCILNLDNLKEQTLIKLQNYVKFYNENSCITGSLGPRYPAVDIMPIALANANRLEKYGA